MVDIVKSAFVELVAVPGVRRVTAPKVEFRPDVIAGKHMVEVVARELGATVDLPAHDGVYVAAEDADVPEEADR